MMFTGIVEAEGTVGAVVPGEDVRRLRIQTPPGYLDGLVVGASIAVDGACLTATALDGAAFDIDIVRTTLDRTISGAYAAGASVNLERALSFGDRLEGHLVQGHIDGVGTVVSVRAAGEVRYIDVRVPEAVHDRTIEYGSIALNGVSLTVNRLLDGLRVEVAVIPHTWQNTNLRYLEPGGRINVEGDVIGKYVFRSLETSRHSRNEAEDAI